MKTKIKKKILIFSCLYVATTLLGNAQASLFRADMVEKIAKRPALSCFSTSCAGFHCRNDFAVKEMMFAEVYGIWIRHRNVILASVNHYGYANYGDMQLSVGYGRNFGDRFAMTARLFYMMAHARDYPARHSLCADFAVACKINPKLYMDVAVYNPFVMRYGIVGQEVIPLEFRMGCTYAPLPKLLMSCSVAKSLPGAWEVDCRLMTQPVVPLLLAVDCSNTRLGVFIGLIYKKFLFSVQAAWYYRISVSPQVGGQCYWEDGRMMGG